MSYFNDQQQQQQQQSQLPVVVLSALNLSTNKKSEIYDMLIHQNAQFTTTTDGSGYVATLRLPDYAINELLFPKRVIGVSRSLSPTQFPPHHPPSDSAFSPETTQKLQRRPPTISAADFEKITYTLSTHYPYFALYSSPKPPKAHAPVWAMKLVDEIYDYRYMKETELANSGLHDDDESKEDMRVPAFVVEFLAKKYGLKKLLDQNCWDFMYNLELYRKKYLMLEIFAKFLGEDYDTDDLQFFLYARNITQIELAKKSLQPKTSINKMKPQFIQLNIAQAIAKTVFSGSPLATSFTSLAESFLRLKKRSPQGGLEINELLMLFLVEYHKTRPTNDSTTSTSPTTDLHSSQEYIPTHDTDYSIQQHQQQQQYLQTQMQLLQQQRIIQEQQQQLQQLQNQVTKQSPRKYSPRQPPIPQYSPRHQHQQQQQPVSAQPNIHSQKQYPIDTYNEAGVPQPRKQKPSPTTNDTYTNYDSNNYDSNNNYGSNESYNNYSSYNYNSNNASYNTSRTTPRTHDTSIEELSDRLSNTSWISPREFNPDDDISAVISEELGHQLNNFVAGRFNVDVVELEHLIMSDMLVGLHTSMASYLDGLMRLSVGLPAIRIESIRAEAESYLQTILALLLTEMQQSSTEWLRKDDDPIRDEALQYREELQARLEQLVTLPFADDSEEMTERRQAEISSFCNALMGAPEIRKRVEPLVAYLITLARRELSKPPPTHNSF